MTKDSNPKPRTIIRLTKIKQWYLPVDAESYLALRKIKLPLTRVHQDLLPTIQMVTQRRNIRAKLLDFKTEIYEPFFDRVGRQWLKAQHRDCTLGSKELRFETLKRSAYAAAKEVLPSLEACLRRFFERWGYTAQFEYSESRGKIRFVVTYQFDSTRQPIIALEQQPEAIPEIKLKLGFTRLVLKLGQVNAQNVERTAPGSEDRSTMITKAPEVEVRIEVSRGGSWAPLHTSTCLYSEISSVLPLMQGLASIVNTDSTNLDQEIQE